MSGQEKEGMMKAKRRHHILTDAEIISIKNQLGRSYNSIGLMSNSGACVLARAIEREVLATLTSEAHP